MSKWSIRIWILAIVVILSIVAIKPNPFASGLQIRSIESGDFTANGISTGQKLLKINDASVSNLEEFNTEMAKLQRLPFNLTIKTDSKIYNYQTEGSLGFKVDDSLNVTESDVDLKVGEKVIAINSKDVNNITDFNTVVSSALNKRIIKIQTDGAQAVVFTGETPKISVKPTSKTNLKLGLDLEGGTRVLLKPKGDAPLTDSEINDLISVLNNRLNVYGLSDLKIRSAADWSGEKFILIEIAGVSKQEVKDLIDNQGQFKAKIGNVTVFEGGKKDIPFVCRNDGSCSGIKNCGASNGGYACRFEFVIQLSADAAKRHAEATRNLETIFTENNNKILNKNIDFYLDDKLVDSLQIGSDLKGSETTSIAISGPGGASTRNGAIDNAVFNMNKLQTILITGSLPVDLEIVKLDSISPVLGKNFLNNIILVVFLALLSVILVLVIRYRSLAIITPIAITLFSELIIILGFAALFQWNLDVVAIAGIIAAIGTGVDDQIVIIDETMKSKSDRSANWKEKIKRAFFIIFAAYAATIAAMVPLWNAGAGLVRGFALTTIVGVSIGVFITRPAFAVIVEKLLKNKE